MLYDSMATGRSGTSVSIEGLRDDYIARAIEMESNDTVATFRVPQMTVTETVALMCVLIEYRDYDIVEIGHYLQQRGWPYSEETLSRLYNRHYGTDPFLCLWNKTQFGNLDLTFRIAE